MTNSNRAYLEVITGGMFAGKSTELIGKGDRHARAGKKVVYCKPTTDDRHSINAIVTHSGIEVEAVVLDPTFYKLYVHEWLTLQEADVVLIDEAQFFESTLLGVVQSLLDQGKTVYVAGLDMDYTGALFNGMANLMAVADTVTKLKAVCKHCGEDAYQSLRISEETGVTVVGGSETYEPVCRECFIKAEEQQNTEIL